MWRHFAVNLQEKRKNAKMHSLKSSFIREVSLDLVGSIFLRLNSHSMLLNTSD